MVITDVRVTNAERALGRREKCAAVKGIVAAGAFSLCADHLKNDAHLMIW